MTHLKHLFVLAAGLVAGIVLAGDAPPAGEAVTLEFKLQRGMELRYSIQGGMTQSGAAQEGEVKIAGTGRALVCEVDAKTGAIMLGGLGSVNTTMKKKDEVEEHKECLVVVAHMDRSGKPIPRQPQAQAAEKDAEKADPKRQALRRMLASVGQAPLVQSALPPRPIKVGGTWEEESAPMDFGSGGKATFTLLAIKAVDGRRHAVIKGQGALVKNDEFLGGDATQELEMLFDVDRGLMVESKVRYTVALRQGGEAKVELGVKLAGVRTVTGDELTATLARFTAMDGALARFHAGEFDKGVDDLQKLRAAEKDGEWQAAYDTLLRHAQAVK